MNFALPSSFAAIAANFATTSSASIARTADLPLLSLNPSSPRLPASLFRFAGQLQHFELEFALAAFSVTFALLASPAPATPSWSAAAPPFSASSAHSSDQIATTPTSSYLPPCEPALP